MWRLLDKVHRLGYRRPGLVIGRYEEEPSAHAYLSVYLGWSHLVLGSPAAIPVLQLERVEEQPIASWYAQHRPNVLLFVHHYDALPSFQAILQRQKLRAPRDVGVAVIAKISPAPISPASRRTRRSSVPGPWNSSSRAS